MNVDGYFMSMGNAIAKERTGIEILRSEAEYMLTIWDRSVSSPAFLPHRKERGEAPAANLRGTLKNTTAPASVIQSLLDDLRWCHKRGCGVL